MDLCKGLGNLTYSTLVHPADDWEQLWASVRRYLPEVKARVAPNQKRSSGPARASRRRRWRS